VYLLVDKALSFCQGPVWRPKLDMVATIGCLVSVHVLVRPSIIILLSGL